MLEAEKRMYRVLLVVDVLLIVISMISGPLNHSSIAIGSGVSAAVISLCLIAYGIWLWPRRR